MVKDDSLYVIAIVAVVAVVGLVIMATGSSSTVMVAEDLPSMAEDSDSTAIAGQAYYKKSADEISIGSWSTGYDEESGARSLVDRGYGLKQEIGEFGILCGNDQQLHAEIDQILEKHGIAPIDTLSADLESLHQNCDW